jgi:hypothetical protein
MRKRYTDPGTITPEACGHRLLTFAGKAAPARAWGSTEALATPEELSREVAAAHADHLQWVPGVRGRVVRPEVLGPDGEPFTYQRARWLQ